MEDEIGEPSQPTVTPLPLQYETPTQPRYVSGFSRLNSFFAGMLALGATILFTVWALGLVVMGVKALANRDLGGLALGLGLLGVGACGFLAYAFGVIAYSYLRVTVTGVEDPQSPQNRARRRL